MRERERKRENFSHNLPQYKSKSINVRFENFIFKCTRKRVSSAFFTNGKDKQESVYLFAQNLEIYFNLGIVFVEF